MGAVSAIGAGLSVVSGISQLGAQQKQAKAQRQMLDKQDAYNKLQAQLQLFQLQNTRKLDELNDVLVDAASKQAYMQTDAGLKIQEQMNAFAASNAMFSGQVQQQQAAVGEKQAQMDAATQKTDAALRAGAEAIELMSGASSEELSAASATLESLMKGGDRQNAIAQLLDVAASSGGVNQALALLSESDAFAGNAAEAKLARGGQLTADMVSKGLSASEASKRAVGAQADVGLAGAGLAAETQRFEGRATELDADYARRVAELGFSGQRQANEANYKIGLMQSGIERSSRYLMGKANEEALNQGQALQSDIVAAQRSTIRSPGLFDYLGVGFGAYNTYNQLSYVPPSLNRSVARSGSSVIRQGVDVNSSYRA
jgi:hypothetical protein